MSVGSESVKKTFYTKLNLIRRYKQAIGCQTCGERRLPALELHHREPELKDRRLDKVKANGKRTGTGGDRWRALSFAGIIDEIAKCDVICANCHRVQRFTDEGWAKVAPDVRERSNIFRLQLEEIVEEAERIGRPYTG